MQKQRSYPSACRTKNPIHQHAESKILSISMQKCLNQIWYTSSRKWSSVFCYLDSIPLNESFSFSSQPHLAVLDVFCLTLLSISRVVDFESNPVGGQTLIYWKKRRVDWVLVHYNKNSKLVSLQDYEVDQFLSVSDPDGVLWNPQNHQVSI